MRTLKLSSRDSKKISDFDCKCNVSVEFLGKIIRSEGFHPSPKKVKAILKVVSPTDVSELRSFLGIVNHYGRLIECLADLSSPSNWPLKRTNSGLGILNVKIVLSKSRKLSLQTSY